MTVSRRRLLAAAAVLLLGPRRGFAAAVDEAEALLALLPDRNAAAKLGEIWVQQEHPQASDVLQNLRQRLGGGDAARLRDAVAEDFRNGTVVNLVGWRVARTQAELCTLAYFSVTNSL